MDRRETQVSKREKELLEKLAFHRLMQATGEDMEAKESELRYLERSCKDVKAEQAAKADALTTRCVSCSTTGDGRHTWFLST